MPGVSAPEEADHGREAGRDQTASAGGAGNGDGNGGIANLAAHPEQVVQREALRIRIAVTIGARGGGKFEQLLGGQLRLEVASHALGTGPVEAIAGQGVGDPLLRAGGTSSK